LLSDYKVKNNYVCFELINLGSKEGGGRKQKPKIQRHTDDLTSSSKMSCRNENAKRMKKRSSLDNEKKLKKN